MTDKSTTQTSAAGSEKKMISSDANAAAITCRTTPKSAVVERVRVELWTINRIVSATEQDWANFDRASKRLGGPAERALASLKDRIACILECTRDAEAALADGATSPIAERSPAQRSEPESSGNEKP
jgi:hypothetical protein